MREFVATRGADYAAIALVLHTEQSNLTVRDNFPQDCISAHCWRKSSSAAHKPFEFVRGPGDRFVDRFAAWVQCAISGPLPW
jgi:hypothetical protein